MTKSQATKKFQEADDRWGMLLFVTYGKQAAEIRYTAQAEGKPGSALRKAFELRMAAMAEFTKAWSA